MTQRTKLRQILLIGAAALAGGAAAAKPCIEEGNDVACTIAVGVREISLLGSTKCFVFLARPLQQFWVGFAAPALITWEIDGGSSAGYGFTDAGISFTGSPPTFDPGKVSSDRMSFAVNNKKTTTGVDYKYKISVYKGGVACELDPWVRNQ